MKALALAATLAATLGGPAFSADVPVPAASPSAAAAPRIVVEPMSFEFGTVRAGHVVQKVVSSCGCTGALTESQTVKPGGSTPLRVTLTAPDEPGRLQKSVLIKSNDPARPTVEVKIEATILAAKKP